MNKKFEKAQKRKKKLEKRRIKKMIYAKKQRDALYGDAKDLLDELKKSPGWEDNEVDDE
jgi:hypothetical protein